MDNPSDIFDKSIVVLGCGNVLFGDDGFGPIVADCISTEHKIPSHVAVINAGTSVRGILFDIILSEKKPKRIIIVDAVDCGRQPGELFEISPDEIPKKKQDDFSMHQMPTSNLLKELKELCSVDVRILVCQVDTIPDVVTVGLSPAVKNSTTNAVNTVLGLLDNI